MKNELLLNIKSDKLQNFTYPDYDVPFVTAFNGRYECVFVIFHPFVALSENIAMKVTDYLSEKMIIEFGKKINWSWMAKQSNLDNCSTVNQALLTSIGALREQHQDQSNFARLNKIIDT